MFSFYRVPELDFADIIPLNPPEPVLDIGIGDDVIAHGKNGVDYKGFVKATDPYQALVLVQIVDPTCPNSRHVAWWEVKYVEKETAVAAA